MRTVLITGASSGIGKETARLFSSNGWNVIATMRDPQAEDELARLGNVLVARCDVTDPDSIRRAIDEGIAAFGSIDVLVNNAGYYLLGPLEAMTGEQIKRQIDTNLLGLIEVTRAMVPHFREQRSGVVVNLSSIAGVITIPLQSLYHATKWGVEGFSEALQYELRQFNVKVRIIEPGVIKTDFLGRSMTLAHDPALSDYEPYVQKVTGSIYKNGETGSSPEVVAQSIYRAATKSGGKMRYSIGKLKEMILLRRLLPVRLNRLIMRSVME